MSDNHGQNVMKNMIKQQQSEYHNAVRKTTMTFEDWLAGNQKGLAEQATPFVPEAEGVVGVGAAGLGWGGQCASCACR